MNLDNVVILAFVGMAGSGKSSCVEYVSKKYPGLPPVLYFGGITMDEVAKRGLPVNEANEKLVREDIRAKEGLASHAKRISNKVDQLVQADQKRIVVDGLYSWSEYKFFKEKYGQSAVIVAVVAPRLERHARLANRPVRPLDPQSANQRDYNEIEGLEKGGPIANADYILLNSSTLENLQQQIDDLLKKINF